MKNYSAKNTWNADETAIFINDQGRSTFAPRDYVGRLVACEKQRVTGLLYIDEEGAIAFVQQLSTPDFQLVLTLELLKK